jgi:tripartite-type tricarboxylate transporter receptor subunit TctC
MMRVVFALAAAMVSIACGTATAETFPTHPITMIVPFSAGGPTDVTARIIGDAMSRTLGQQIVIENVGGAGGTIGATRAMRAKPDGYTIVMGQLGTHAASVALYPNLAYRPDADFAPIGRVVDQVVLIAARKDFPPNNLGEFIAYVRANSTKLNIAHAGVGSISHFTCLLLDAVLGAKPTMVPFNGTAPAINAMVAGQIDYMCDPISDIVQQFQAGTIKVYAIGTAERHPALPDIPTAKEAGLPQFEVSAWYSLFAPKDTPKPILDILSAALDKSLDDDTVRKRMSDLGCDIPIRSQRGQQALADLVRSDVARWSSIIRAASSNQQ